MISTHKAGVVAVNETMCHCSYISREQSQHSVHHVWIMLSLTITYKWHEPDRENNETNMADP